MAKKQVSEKDLAQMEVVKPEVLEKEVEQVPQKEFKVTLNGDDVNVFLNIIGLVLYKDDRMKTLQNHFLDIINNRSNEQNKQQ